MCIRVAPPSVRRPLFTHLFIYLFIYLFSDSPVPGVESSPSPPVGVEVGVGGGANGVGGGAPRRRRRARTLFDESALACLETAFCQDRYPDITRREELAAQIGVPEARVQVRSLSHSALDYIIQ